MVEVGRSLDIADKDKFPLFVAGFRLQEDGTNRLSIVAVEKGYASPFAIHFAPTVRTMKVMATKYSWFNTVGEAALFIDTEKITSWSIATNGIDKDTPSEEVFSKLSESASSNYFIAETVSVVDTLNSLITRALKEPVTYYLNNFIGGTGPTLETLKLLSEDVKPAVTITDFGGNMAFLGLNEADKYHLLRFSLVPEAHMRHTLYVDDTATPYLLFYSEVFTSGLLSNGGIVPLALVALSEINLAAFSQYVFNIYGERAPQMLSLPRENLRRQIEHVKERDEAARDIHINDAFKDVVDYIYNFIHFSLFVTGKLNDTTKLSKEISSILLKEATIKPIRELPYGVFADKELIVLSH